MRIRPPSSSWSWLKRSVFSSVAGYTATGIVTSPKLMAPFHIVLGMVDPSGGSCLPTRTQRKRDSMPWSDMRAGLGEDRAERVRREHPDPVPVTSTWSPSFTPSRAHLARVQLDDQHHVLPDHAVAVRLAVERIADARALLLEAEPWTMHS